MAILTFVSSLTVVIYLNIQKSSTPFIKIRAAELAELYLNETISKKDYSETSVKKEQFELKKSVANIDKLPDCILLRVMVFNESKKKIVELEHIIYNGGGRVF